MKKIALAQNKTQEDGGQIEEGGYGHGEQPVGLRQRGTGGRRLVQMAG